MESQTHSCITLFVFILQKFTDSYSGCHTITIISLKTRLSKDSEPADIIIHSEIFVDIFQTYKTETRSTYIIKNDAAGLETRFFSWWPAGPPTSKIRWPEPKSGGPARKQGFTQLFENMRESRIVLKILRESSEK